MTDFIGNANATAEATAARRDDIERGIERLPAFLRELRPLMVDLNGFAGQATPVVRDLNTAGDDISRLITQLGPFSEGARVSLKSLGQATETGRPALIRTRPLIRDLADFGQRARPVSTNLDKLTASIDRTGGIERIMDFVYFSTLSFNGFDEISHYLRAATLVNTCSGYALVSTPGCDAHYTPTRAISAAVPSVSADVAPEPDQAAAGPAVEPGPVLQDKSKGIDDATGTQDAAEPVLDYLLGGGG